MTMQNLDFNGKSALGVGLLGLILLTPFAINNFYQGRVFLGIGSLSIVIILAVNAWSIVGGRYYPSMILFGLVPPIIFFLSLSLQQQGLIGVLWCYPAIISFYFMLPERRAWISNIALLVIVVPQVWSLIDHSLASRVTVTFLCVSAFSAIFIRVILDQQQSLHTMAVTDPLTGVNNRALLNETLDEAILQGNRGDVSMTLITLDLDRFKQINDQYGHETGDGVLKAVANYLKKSIRSTDRVFRMGGEEFLIFLYSTELVGGRKFAEKLRSEIASLSILPDQPVTVSMGLAMLQPGETRNRWIRRCDENLYLAKSGGRNAVVC